MVNRELLMIFSMTAGGLLFALGGYKWKWLRRFVLPFLFIVILLLNKQVWWKAVVCGVGLMGAFCLPYGDRTPWWLKFLVGVTYVLPTLVLGFTLWQPLYMFLFFCVFALSNWKPTAKMYEWKICEFIFGAGIGVIIANLLC